MPGKEKDVVNWIRNGAIRGRSRTVAFVSDHILKAVRDLKLICRKHPMARKISVATFGLLSRARLHHIQGWGKP